MAIKDWEAGFRWRSFWVSAYHLVRRIPGTPLGEQEGVPFWKGPGALRELT